jgi:EmrB/QacA subfamily drug resistance transporter
VESPLLANPKATGAKGSQASPVPTPVTRAQFLNLFVAVFLPMFMAAVDQTLLATATPAIAASLGGLRDTSWIMVAYLLAAAVIAPVYGRLGDAHGRCRMLLVALGVFTVGSLACGLAQSLSQLVAGRVLQGLGGGGLMVLSQALIGELVPPLERIRFQGYFALMFTTASIGGPVIGGVVVTHLDWRWLFFANLPFAAFAAWRLSRLPPGERHARAGARPDVAGHALFAIGALATLFWLTSAGHRFEWFSMTSLALVTVAAVTLSALIWHERRHESPFLPVDLLRERTIRLSAVLVSLFAACLFAVVFFLPVYLQLGHRVSADIAGLLLLPVSAGQVSGTMVASRIVRRMGEGRIIPIVGMTTASCALLLLALLPPHLGVVIGLGFMTGLGLGSVMPVNQVVVQTVAGRSRLGAVTAMTSLARSTGGAAGAAIFGAIIFALASNVDGQSLLHRADPSEVEHIIRAFHRSFLFAAGVAAFAAWIASRIPRVNLRQA